MWFFNKSSKSTSSSKSSATQRGEPLPAYSRYSSRSTPNLLDHDQEVAFAPATAFKKQAPFLPKKQSLPKVKVNRDDPLLAGPTSISRRNAHYRDDTWEATKRCRSCEGDNLIDPSQVGKYVACKHMYFGMPCPGHFHVTQRDALKAKKSRELKESWDFLCSGEDELPKKYKIQKERWPVHYKY